MFISKKEAKFRIIVIEKEMKRLNKIKVTGYVDALHLVTMFKAYREIDNILLDYVEEVDEEEND